MKRVLVSVVVVCLVLSACGSQATPDTADVARLVEQAVKATVAAMPTPEHQTVEVEKIVKETAIVEKVVEVTVIVEKEAVATPTPEPPTPTPELTIEGVIPADARASAFVSGNASPELPAGERGVGECPIYLITASGFSD